MVKSTQRVGLLLVLIASVGIAICNAQKSLTSPHNAIDAVFFSLDLDGSATLSLDELNRFIMRYQHVKPTQHAVRVLLFFRMQNKKSNFAVPSLARHCHERI
jgi:hypothetical protein